MCEYFLWMIMFVCLFLWMNNKLCQLDEAGYGKMNMGHVGSPHCTLAHILVFFFCVATGIWYFPLFFTREAGSWICTNSELTFDFWKNRGVCGVKHLRAYWGSCSCWCLYFGYMEGCSFHRCQWSTGLPKLGNRRSAFSFCLIQFTQFSRCGRIFPSIIVVFIMPKWILG